MKIQDLRGQTMGGIVRRQESDIKKIARHHSATVSGNAFVFEKSWREKGWKTGGYHEIILRDGTVQICYDPTIISNGVGGQNSYIYNICLVGNGNFTTEQEETFQKRALLALKRFNLKVSDVLGHKEFPGQNTACPGIDMNLVRSWLEKSQKEGSTMNQQPDTWAKEAWEKATKVGVTDGTRPKDALTRQEFIVILDRLGMIK